MKRIALGLEYDGSRFLGWQSQRGGNTIQDVLEAALGIVAAGPVRVVCAGRTDRGVHATAQVVHFDTVAERPLTAWVRGCNAHLPEQVSVTGAQVVSPDFHARFSAIERRYRYLLLNRPQRPGLLADRVGWYHRPLEVEIMQRAAKSLVGEHDFSAFRSSECQAKSPVRVLRDVRIFRENDVISFELEANGFLHHMVRNIVGTLIQVGIGKRPASWTSELLEERDRNRAAPTFSPAGLYLVGVGYDPRWGLKVGTGDTVATLAYQTHFDGA